MHVLQILLVIGAVLAALSGLGSLTVATAGVGGVAGACFLAILARLAQSSRQHDELKVLFNNLQAQRATETEPARLPQAVGDDQVACKNCGAVAPKGSAFCTTCGAKF